MKNFLLLVVFSSLLVFNAKSEVKFSPLINHTDEQKEIALIAQDLTNQVVKTNCFRDVMLTREYSGKKGLIDTNGRTALEVVEHLRSIDGSVPVHMYYKNNGVVGYRQPPYPDVHTNAKFHNGSSACARASNLSHEVLGHSLGGYGHSYRANINRPRSVPYSLNEVFSQCCACEGIKDCIVIDELGDKPAQKTKRICYRTWYTLWLKTRCYTKTL